MKERLRFVDRKNWGPGDKEKWKEKIEASFQKGLDSFPKSELMTIFGACELFFFPEKIFERLLNDEPIVTLVNPMKGKGDAEFIVNACVMQCLSMEILRRESREQETTVEVTHGSDNPTS